ncbi:hypothetical protein SH2C18_51800 [Clostridium sediminicola]|uniref:DUF6142 family protein n=1 Tax=Clostridium sediminicola TaxID=3114879 RepID=UPI0031F21F7C
MEYKEVDTEEEKVKRHSKVGISSFVSGILAITLFLSISTLPLDETNSELVIGIIAIFSVLIAMVGTILGIIGILNKKKKRIFAIIGVILNLMLVLFFIVLMISG